MDWFELKNGSSIGISDEGLIYGQRTDAAGRIIDEELRHNSTIDLSKYPDGFDIELCPAFGWARIQRNKYRFSTPETAAAFKEALLQHFPLSFPAEERPKVSSVIREPLIALLLLIFLFTFSLQMHRRDPQSLEGLGKLAADIPLPFLIGGYVMATALSVYFIWRLRLELKATEFWVILKKK
jgi:hypothetical protein